MNGGQGFPFYKVKLNKKGEPKINKYGFECLSCNRGTPDVENIHKLLLTIYGTWHVGIEMSDYLLRERRHRHNHKASELRRYLFPRIGHYDTWLIDAIQKYVEVNHGVSMYPTWVNASDYRNTEESFGTIALHDEELAMALNNIQVDEEILKNLTNDMKYLCRTMTVKLPFLPIDTDEEKLLYSRLTLAGITDPNRMALEWIKSVDGKNIFPKLPVHLRNYKQTFDRNRRVQLNFEGARSQVELLAELNATLCPEPERTSDQLATVEEENEEVVENPPPVFYSQWENIQEVQPFRMPQASALHSRHVSSIGGTTFPVDPRLLAMTATHGSNRKRGRGKRGEDKGERRKRRCRCCRQYGTDGEKAKANECRGRKYASLCTIFKEDGSRR